MEQKQSQVNLDLLKAMVSDFDSYDALKNRLAFDPNVYGSTYTIENVRESVQDGFPVVARLQSGGDDRCVTVVGEDVNGLWIIPSGEEKPVYWQDKKLRRHWTGEVIIVCKVSQYGSRQAEEEEDPVQRSIIIRNQMKDTWPDDRSHLIDRTMKTLERINTVPAWMLPDHPVILVFQEETPEDRKNHARAYSLGVHIYIIDPSDPVEEFLHELGHVYYDTRLDDHCKELMQELHATLEKTEQKPGVFTAKWDYVDPVELFCTLYMWRMKGEFLSSGFREILKKQYPEGDKCISTIFSYVLQKSTIEKQWFREERIYGRYYRALRGQETLAKVSTSNGMKLRKAKVPVRAPKATVAVPETIRQRSLSVHGNREYVHILEGALEGAVLPLTKAGIVDVQAMERLASQKRLGLYPVQYERLNKAGRRSVKTVWQEPGARYAGATRVTVTVDPEEAKQELGRLQKAFQSIKDLFSKMGKIENGESEERETIPGPAKTISTEG